MAADEQFVVQTDTLFAAAHEMLSEVRCHERELRLATDARAQLKAAQQLLEAQSQLAMACRHLEIGLGTKAQNVIDHYTDAALTQQMKVVETENPSGN